MTWPSMTSSRWTRFPVKSIRSYSHLPSEARLKPVIKLSSWDAKRFQEEAFTPARPATLPFESKSLPPASRKWFIHNPSSKHRLSEHGPPRFSSLNPTFWKHYESLMVPLEYTQPVSTSPGRSVFHRSDAPLKLLLDYLEQAVRVDQSIYLAQCSLPSLPVELQADLPTPEIILRAGRGDIYDSSLWLGLPPTYTPLHRDPNPNLLMQLAGRKVVRLFPPDVGLAVFERVQQAMGLSGSSVFRGVEMMQGAEKELLEREVWDDEQSLDPEKIALRQEGYEAQIDLGEAIFIPKGWWHSVKGIGDGVTASVNWWFR